MISRGNRMKAAGLAISLMSLWLSVFCPTALAVEENKSPAAERLIKRLGEGINVDVSQPE